MKLVKNIIAVVAILVMILALYVSYTEPVKSEVIRKEGTFGSATWDVTYQPKNIYGIAIGEDRHYVRNSRHHSWGVAERKIRALRGLYIL